MDIITFNTLLSEIRNGDEDTASKLLKGYGDKRAKAAIEESWKRSHRLLECAMHNREKRIKDHILDYDPDQSVLTLVSFTKYFAAIESLIKKHAERCSEETNEVLSDINDAMYQALGSIKIDKRLIFTKQD